MGQHRPSLLGKPHLVDNHDAATVDMCSHTQQRADCDHAGTPHSGNQDAMIACRKIGFIRFRQYA